MGPKKASRRSAAELRKLILDAGLSVLYRRGLRATASHVPMTEALAELESTHGTALSMGSIFGKGRLWPSVKEFQIDLFAAAVADDNSDGPTDASRENVERLPNLRDAPYDERIAALAELCRLGGLLNDRLIRWDKQRTWSLWAAIWAIAVSDSEAGDELLPMLRASELRTAGGFAELVEVALERLRLRVADGYTLAQFATAATALTDGIKMRSTIVPERVHGLGRPDDDQEWSLLGIGVFALAMEFFEDDVPA